ncbi:MAG: FecR domain-containing protein, partial [Phycisphaeraceae bacterium JB051]
MLQRGLVCLCLCWALLPATLNAQPVEPMRFEMLEFKAAQMGSVARTLSEASGVNIVVSPKAAAYPITVYLNNISIDDAIDLITRTNNLFYRRVGDNIYRVMTVEEFQSNLHFVNKQKIRVFELKHPNPVTVGTAIEDLFGGRVEMSISDDDEDELQVSGGGISGNNNNSSSSNRYSNSSDRYSSSSSSSRYNSGRYGSVNARARNAQMQQLTADQLAQLTQADPTGKLDLAQLETGIGEEMIYVSVVKQHNLISVRTTDDNALRDIEELIKQLDRPMAQVLLEMELLEVSLTDDFTSLFNWSFAGGPVAEGGNPLDVNATVSNQSVLGLGNFALGGGTAVYQFLDNNLRVQVEMLKQDGRVNTIATPSVLATNNRESRLFVGTEQPVRVGVDAEVAAE